MSISAKYTQNFIHHKIWQMLQEKYTPTYQYNAHDKTQYSCRPGLNGFNAELK